MQYITLIKIFDQGNGDETAKIATTLFDGKGRRITEIRLAAGATLPKHKANVPITVYCVFGSGTFRAGPGLEDSQKLKPGALITLEPEVEHEVSADEPITLIVTRFLDS